MKSKYLFTSLAILALAASAATWSLTRSSAQQGDAKAAGDGKTAAQLPIGQVILFNSGVGYFERQGDVAGDTRVELSFPTSDVNDLLKSLVLQDTAGGRVDAISLDSQDPLDKILHSFALDLNNNPTYGQILNQARGEKIELLRQEKPGANPLRISGTIIGMEAHRETTGKDTTVDIEQVNLLTGEGMLAVPLTQVMSVRFLNQRLENEFQRALHVLAGAHDVQKKTVALHFTGNGKRTVKVGYVVERPIWKTSYRLVSEPNGKMFMQGWAIVENTSDDDWNNVRMVLVSGKPITFRMDLYSPLYIPRPLVEPELFASLRPPLYGDSFGLEANKIVVREEEADLARKSSAAKAEKGGRGLGIGLISPPVGGGTATKYANTPATGQFFNGVGGNSNALPAQQKLTYEQLQQRNAAQQSISKDAKAAGSAIAGLNFKEGVQSIASASEVGDYFQYVIDQKISLARQKSAMLPILNQSIEGTKVSIFNEAVHTKFPLLGMRLKNTSGKPLTQGPITVYDDGSYAGDTRMLDLQPNEERLLSYALDLGTEVKATAQTHAAPDMTLKIGGNNLTAVYTMRQTKTYTVKNRSTHDRTLIVEHPIRGDWKLVDPKKPSDRSRDVYRFQIEVKAGATVKLDVAEDQTRTDPFALIGRMGDVPPYYGIVDGIQIKPQINTDGGKLLSLSINKGVLEATYKEHVSKTYFIQNQSERDHNFTVDHIIAKDWKRLSKDGKVEEAGPAIYTFKVDVKSKQSASQEVVEERVYQDHSQVVAKVDGDVLRKFIAHKAPAANVKAALQQVLDKQANLKTATKELADLKVALGVLTQDQARVRENLKIIPQTSEHYKDFLKKFVAQETQIDEEQRAIRTKEAAVQKMQNEYETFVTTLTAK